MAPPIVFCRDESYHSEETDFDELQQICDLLKLEHL